jgi:tight adherence protein B
MPHVLLLPAIALVGLLLIAAALVGTMGRQRQVSQRVDGLGATTTELPAEPDPATTSIRRRAVDGGARRRRLRALFLMPEELELAHVVPPWLVFAFGTVIGSVSIALLRAVASLPASVAIGSFLGIVTVRGLFEWERDRYKDKLLRQLPDAIELIVSSTRAGLPISEALRSVARETVSPTRDEFGKVTNEIMLGVPADQAMVAMYRRTDLTEYSILAVTLAVQSRSGGRLAESLQNVAETARQRVALAGKAAALAAEGKLSAGILSVLPFLAAIVMPMMQPDYIHDFTGTPGGRHMIVVALSSLTLGILTMRWMIKRSTAP